MIVMGEGRVASKLRRSGQGQSQELEREVWSHQGPRGYRGGWAHRSASAMAMAIGWALLQAAGRAPPAGLAGAHAGGLALPVAAAAPGAQGEAEGGVEAQQVVVGIAEEMEKHLQAQDGQGSGDWMGRVVRSRPQPTLGVPTSCPGLSPPFFVPVSFCLMPSFSCCLSDPPPLLPSVHRTPLSSKHHLDLQPDPAALPHQPCLRRPRWAEAECSHSDWQAGALGESRHHTRIGSRTCIPCPGKGSPAGSGAGGLGLGSENRGAGLRGRPSPRASRQPSQEHQALLCVTLGTQRGVGPESCLRGAPGLTAHRGHTCDSSQRRNYSISPGKGS